MKRFKILLIILFLVFILPTVYAGTAYVDDINIDAKINTDGSMTVEETILWDIEEDLNGVYRDILIKNPANEFNSASGIVVEKVEVEGKEFTCSYSELQNGDSGKYNINDIEGGKQIKIYRPLEDEYVTTTITYTLYDVVVVYNDIAEMYWNFIGSGWEYGIDNVSINISLPGNSDVLKIFAHGPLYGYSEIVSNDSVVLKVENLRSNEQVDARLLLDKSLVDTTKVVNEDKLENVLQEEAVLAKQANVKRELAKKAFYASIVLVVIALIIPVVILIKVKKKSLKSEFNGKYYRELPEDYGPAIMNKVLFPVQGVASSNDMLATLLDLVRRKYVEIEPLYKNNKKKPYDYKLKLVKEDISELNESEQHLIQKMIFVDVNEITLNEISKKNSKSMKAQQKAYEAYEKWSELLKKIAEEKDLLREKPIKNGKNIFICVIITLAVTAFGVGFDLSDIVAIGGIGLFICVFEVLFICLKIADLGIRTQKGVNHESMWKAFKKFLLDFSKLDEHDYKSIAIWEHYLVYATGLGISKQVIKELKLVYPTEFEQNSSMLNTYATISLLSDDNFSGFTNSFNTAASTAFSSPSSSNGSGGGFSGGAGGRRRRWWWRWILNIVTNKKRHGEFHVF